MKHTCKYHPGESATWYCPGDGMHFCEDCVASDDSVDGGRARCFLCNKPLTQIRRQVAQDPFWKILSHFMQYPVSREAMLVVAALALVTALLPGSWVGIGIAAVVAVPLGALAAAVMDHTANARMRIPGFQVLQQPENYAKGAQVWLVFAAVMAALGFCFVQFGMLQGAGIAFLAWLVLPVFLIMVFLDGNILSPLFGVTRLVNAMLSIGVDYLLAAVFLFAGFLGVSLVASIFYDLLPSFIAFPVTAMAAGWFWLMMAHLLGYLICQHREALGYTSPANDDLNLRQRRSRRPEEERRLGVWMRAGKFEKVVGHYKLKLEKQPGQMALNEQYERLLAALGRTQEQLEHGAKFIDLLMKNQQEYRVIDVFKRYRAMDPAFRPATAQSTWDVARMLAENDQPKLALNLLIDQHKRTPTWPGLTEAYLFVARLLKQEFKLDGKAEQYLRFVETRFRDPKSQQLARDAREQLEMPRKS